MKTKELIRTIRKTPFVIGNIIVNSDIVLDVKLNKTDLRNQLKHYDDNVEFNVSLTKDKTNLFIG